MRKIWKRLGTLALMTLLIGTALLVMAATAPVKSDAPSPQAETVHLFLKANGQKIESDLSRDGSLDLLSYEQSVTTAREAGSGIATGRRQYQPLLIRKRIDKASPLLMKALTENQVIEGTFSFSHPIRNGASIVEEYYRVEIKNARVASYKMVADASGEPMEEVTFVFQTIKWTYTNGGVTHEDTWDQQR